MTTMTRFASIVLASLLLASFPVAAEDEDQRLTGSVEVLYRNVNQNGSTAKYDEDYDGLESGARLGSISLNWADESAGLLDYARLDAYGLGGDPYQRIAGRLGQQGKYQLKVDYSSQDYIYNLFELVRDEDGSAWDATRRRTRVGLTVHATDNIDVFFDYQDGSRTGSSLFLKDVQRNVFQLETPLDQSMTSYGAGVRFQVGTVDLVLRQSHRSYDNNWNNHTSNDLGIEGSSQLNLYDWHQRDRGRTDWTEVKVSTPLGDRVHLGVSFFGTLLGEDELTSHVEVEQLGIGFSGLPFGGTCSVSATVCGADSDCPGGEVCIPDQGFSQADLEGDTRVIDADLSVAIVPSLSLHLRYRSLDRDLDGTALRDLDGDGTNEDLDGDGEDVTTTRLDYQVDSMSAVLEYRPTHKVGLRGGYRVLERELIRSGFGAPPSSPGDPDAFRDTNFKSDDDSTLIFGVTLRPVKWFRFNADYEDGDVEQPFTAPSLYQSEHIRARATFTPQPDMRIGVTWLDFQNENTALDFRQLNAATPPEPFQSEIDGQSWSVNFAHRPDDRWDYDFRYAEQEIDTATAIVVDTGGFGAVEDALSLYANDNKQFRGRVQYRWADHWRAWLQYWFTESSGDNVVLGTAVSTLVPIDQERDNSELGLTYTFDSGIYIGMTIWDFDYTDRGAVGTSLAGVLDYDGQIFTLRGGLTF